MKNFFKACLLRGTPSMVLALGAGFVMASSADIRAALGMGAAVLISMLLTSIVVSAIHKFIPAYAKLPVYLLIITGFVSIIEMVMEAFFPIVVDMLGAHLAALAVSAVIYRDAEEIADHSGEWTSIKAALTTGIFLTVIMVICALIRETLGNATLWGREIAFLANYKVTALAGAFGAYLVLACVLAAIKKLTGAEEHLEGEEHE
ncbi:MAG: hypothetical protein J6S71_07845 [Clostridia bacterium]|nr:hypothetical protein [Clostridia bacterium]